jgi:hypothetical protein
MTEKSQIPIAAFVSENERAAVVLAIGHIARALSHAAAVPWTCDCIFSSDLKTSQQGSDDAIMITSLLPEIESLESWPQIEQRLRSTYTILCESGTPVFICTILRHIGGDEKPEAADTLRIRIRQLNLLAAEISRETGAFVIDLDRVLADIGARRLQTDYRLAGTTAAEMAGHFMALTVIGNGLDAFVPFEIQDAASVFLAASRPALAEVDCAKPELTLRKNLLSMGQGRRKQVVSPVLHTVHDSHVGWVIRQVLKGMIGPTEAFRRLIQVVRRRGVRESTALLASGLSRQIDPKK